MALKMMGSSLDLGENDIVHIHVMTTNKEGYPTGTTL